jgi:hypothetical protein
MRNSDGTFAKGNIGKPKGATNKRNCEWYALKDSIVDLHAERFNKILGSLEGKEFCDVYLKVLEYFKPKISRVAYRSENPDPPKQFVIEIKGRNEKGSKTNMK